jgi:hypothetical protein
MWLSPFNGQPEQPGALAQEDSREKPELAFRQLESPGLSLDTVGRRGAEPGAQEPDKLGVGNPALSFTNWVVWGQIW